MTGTTHETAGTGDTPIPQGEAGSTGAAEDMDNGAVEAMVSSWRQELGGQSSISASLVQDRLLDLWGALPDSAPRAEVERWLTETVARHLYQVGDIERRLESVLAASAAS